MNFSQGEIMILHTIPITNALRLSHIQTDRFKTGVLTFTLLLPTTRENMILNTLLPGILRRGTVRYPDMAALNRRLDELYASCVEIRTARIGKNLALVFTAELLDDAYATDGTSILDGVVEVIAQMLLFPRMEGGIFDSATVEQEKRFERDALRATINNTRAYASARLSELMFREDETVLTLKEREAALEEITAQGLTDYYLRVVATAPMDIFYVGTLSSERVTTSVEKYFGNRRTAQPPKLLLPEAVASSGYLRVTEPMPVSQGKLAMGFRTGAVTNGKTSDSYAARMLNELFGGSPASKLFMNVRERMSLCYYCSSSYSPHTGVITVSSGIDSANFALAEEAILAQLEDIRVGRISEAEFRAARVSLENAYQTIYDNPFDLQTFYGTRILFGISETVEDCRARLLAVTPEQVIRLAEGVLCDTVFFVEGTRTSSYEEECDDE